MEYFQFYFILWEIYISQLSAMRGLILFRSILREHRRLPPQMRRLGDDYVRSEFRLHRTAKPQHLEGFFSEWGKYLISLRTRTDKIGRDLDESSRAVLNEEQRLKLMELKGKTFTKE